MITEFQKDPHPSLEDVLDYVKNNISLSNSFENEVTCLDFYTKLAEDIPRTLEEGFQECNRYHVTEKQPESDDLIEHSDSEIKTLREKRNCYANVSKYGEWLTKTIISKAVDCILADRMN